MSKRSVPSFPVIFPFFLTLTPRPQDEEKQLGVFKQTMLKTFRTFKLYKMCLFVPVCHIISGSLTLRDTNIRDFGVKFYFSKFRMEPVMLSFLATTENIK